MSEYIKREDALEILGAYSKALIDRPGKAVFTCMAYDIRSLPAEDVVERKKGEWLCERLFDWETTNIPVVMVYAPPKCSICGETSLEQTNYCPNCGADMRGGDAL